MLANKSSWIAWFPALWLIVSPSQSSDSNLRLMFRIQLASHVGYRLRANHDGVVHECERPWGMGVVAGPTSLCELLHSEKLGDGRCTLSPPKAGGLADAFWGSDFSLWHCVMWHCVTVGLSWQQQQQQQAGRQARQSLSRSRLGAMEAPGRAEIYQAGRHQTAGGCIRGSRCS
jgi:hypothetical protein